MKNRELTCIVCPRGCALSVTLDDDGHVLSVTGNSCPRGKVYAEKECTHPERTVTTTVRCADGKVLPCKTADTVPKEKIFAVMAHINCTTAPAHVHIGDVLIDNVADTGVAAVATADKP